VASAAVSEAIGRPAWTGPLRFEADGVPYAGALRLVDVDEDERVIGAHAQARATRGWAGVAADLRLRPDGSLDAPEVRLSGEAGDAARTALLDAVAERIADAARTSLADDPAYRRRLAVRAGIAVAVGVAAGLAGAAWDRRRRS
jgi:hypothetical protein